MKNKRIIFLSIIFVAAIFLYAILKFVPDIAFNMGKQAYSEKKYSEAYPLLKFAVKLNPYSRDYRYYFAKTMLRLRPTVEVQKDLFDISQVNLADSADLIADQKISAWQNDIAENAGENYIEQAPIDNKILRWDATKFPIRVNIQNNSTTAPKYYVDTIQKAFMQWQAETGSFIRFKFVDNEADANIIVKINSSNDMKKCEGPDCVYAVAYTTPAISGDLLKNMNILFYDSNNLGKPFSQREIYQTALHEIGHSLGIMGHSQDRNDLMYMANKPDNPDAFNSYYQPISSSDINTLNLLYKLIPDITNTNMATYDKSRQFYAPIVIGSDNQMNSTKLTEAVNYIKSAPNLPNGYIDLSGVYGEMNENSKALEALNIALSLSSNDSERFIIYYNTAIIYTNIKDWQSALKYANMAKSIQTSADINGMIAMIYYNMGNKKVAKETYIEALNQSPDNIIDSVNLATIYLSEFNLAQAGKVLNNLVKANPEATNDPRVKLYWLLMVLFK